MVETSVEEQEYSREKKPQRKRPFKNPAQPSQAPRQEGERGKKRPFFEGRKNTKSPGMPEENTEEEASLEEEISSTDKHMTNIADIQRMNIDQLNTYGKNIGIQHISLKLLNRFQKTPMKFYMERVF
jgi:hypothetical protein